MTAQSFASFSRHERCIAPNNASSRLREDLDNLIKFGWKPPDCEESNVTCDSRGWIKMNQSPTRVLRNYALMSYIEVKVGSVINSDVHQCLIPSSLSRVSAKVHSRIFPECLRNSAHFMAGRKPPHHLQDIRLDGCIFIMRSPPASSLKTHHWMDILWRHLWFLGIVLRGLILSAIFIIEKKKMYRSSCFFPVLMHFPCDPDRTRW